jgi:hypothetical protein
MTDAQNITKSEKAIKPSSPRRVAAVHSLRLASSEGLKADLVHAISQLRRNALSILFLSLPLPLTRKQW